MVKELQILCKNAVHKFQPILEKNLCNEMGSKLPSRAKLGSSDSRWAILKYLNSKCLSRVDNQRAARRELKPLPAPENEVTHLIREIYATRPDVKRLLMYYRRLPHPRPRHLSGQILDDLIQLLFGLRYLDKQGELFRNLVEDMEDASIEVTSRERSFYIWCLSNNYFDLAAVGVARAKVQERMIRWHSEFDNDPVTMENLLEAAIRLDMPSLYDFVVNHGLSSTKIDMTKLKHGKITTAQVVTENMMTPTLLSSLMAVQLKLGKIETAKDLLSHATSQFKNTHSKELSPGKRIKYNNHIQVLKSISAIVEAPITIPLVPNTSMFLVFLSYYTKNGKFDAVMQYLVSMSSHGCFPPTYAMYQILDGFTSDWGSSDLDKLIHYICDVSLYRNILSVPLVKKIASTYGKFDESEAKEIEEFLFSLIEVNKKDRVPTEEIQIEKLLSAQDTERPRIESA